MTDKTAFFYAGRSTCEVCRGGTAIPDVGCYKCHGKGFYQVARIGTVDDWYPYDALHIPPHCVPLNVKETLTHDYTNGPKQEQRVTSAWFDYYLLEFHNEWGKLSGKVTEWSVDGELQIKFDPAKCLGCQFYAQDYHGGFGCARDLDSACARPWLFYRKEKTPIIARQRSLFDETD